MEKLMKTYFAVDPGNVQSGWVLYAPQDKKLLLHGLDLNQDVLERILSDDWGDMGKQYRPPTHMAMELIQSMGMAVGQTVFDTCIWTGRFVQAWSQGRPDNTVQYVPRRNVKMHLCNSMRAKDGNIRQAIMDRYGSTRRAAIGIKKAPGPLYGMSRDRWAAMGVAITAAEGSTPPLPN